MSWVKLDDNFMYNRKVMLAGMEARMLYIAALCHSAHELTDGVIDAELLPVIGAVAGIPDAVTAAAKLVDVGLWEKVDSGYQIHDYHDYNPSAERVKEVRAKRAEAGRIGGQNSRPPVQDSDYGKAKGKQDESKQGSKTEAKENPVPVPIPQSPANAGAEAPPQTGNGKKPTRRRSKQKKPTPTAVKVFRSNANRYPAASWYDDIARAVGEKQTDLDFWGAVVKAYVGLGWNPTNVKTMLEFYKRREIPTTRPGNNNGPPPPSDADIKSTQVRAQR